ncbi:MAG: MFS transporter [Dehalococcoidia bacterium]|nr:MFS transporter [Dehalococcoidia bacterium]
MNESRGYSLALASLSVALLTVSQAVGNLSGGYLGDRYSKQLVSTVCMFVHASAMVLLAYAPTFPLILLASVMHGLAWGTRGPLMMAIRADYFGRTNYGTIVGISQPIVMLGMTTGPIVAGFLFDQTGSYEVGFTTLATLAALGSVFFMLSPRPLRPGEEAAS